MNKLIVTITPPTPNGDLHIGHLAGPFLSADVFARVQRQRGNDCILVSYSDDYQSYMIRKGIELNRDPQEVARENTAKIKATLAASRIEVDHWMSSYENPHFRWAATEVHQAALDARAVTREVSKEPYCPSCRTWGYEAFGRGCCNYCGHDSDASQCEQCAYPPDAAKMTNFRCKLCGGALEWRDAEREFLDIGRYGPYLRTVFDHAPLRPPMDEWANRVLSDGPGKWGITRPGEAGLDLAPDGSRRLHTWFLGMCGYMAATREYAEAVAGRPELYDEYWRSPDVELVNFLGYDCAYSHLVVYPALLSNLPEPRPRNRFYANQFLKLDGDNLSTSRNHAIWAKDLIRDFDADAVRLYLAAIAPEEREGNFQLAVFKEWYRDIFVETIPALLDRAASERAAGTDPLSADDRILARSLRDRWDAVTTVENFSMRSMAQIVLDALAIAAERSRIERPVAFLLDLIGTLGMALHPDLSARISQKLAEDAGRPSEGRRESLALDNAV